MRVGSNHRLNPFILLPVNVTGMVVANQDSPFRTRFAVPFALANLAVHNLRPYSSSPVDVSARIERIGENYPHCTVDWRFPYDFLPMERAHRQGEVLFAEPDQNLTNAPELDHFAEDQLNRLLYALIGILLHLAIRTPAETHRQIKFQLATTGLLTSRFQRPLP